MIGFDAVVTAPMPGVHAGAESGNVTAVGVAFCGEIVVPGMYPVREARGARATLH